MVRMSFAIVILTWTPRYISFWLVSFPSVASSPSSRSWARPLLWFCSGRDCRSRWVKFPWSQRGGSSATSNREWLPFEPPLVEANLFRRIYCARLSFMQWKHTSSRKRHACARKRIDCSCILVKVPSSLYVWFLSAWCPEQPNGIRRSRICCHTDYFWHWWALA